LCTCKEGFRNLNDANRCASRTIAFLICRLSFFTAACATERFVSSVVEYQGSVTIYKDASLGALTTLPCSVPETVEHMSVF
jgi:hypothetical protein